MKTWVYFKIDIINIIRIVMHNAEIDHSTSLFFHLHRLIGLLDS